MASTEEMGWRQSIITQIQARNRTQTHCFQDIILQNNRLFDNANTLRNENLQLSIDNERLKQGIDSGGGGGSSDSKLSERIHQLEQKLLVQQEELTGLHRRKGENAQQIIDLNAMLKEKEKELAERETAYDESRSTCAKLRAEIRMYESSMGEIKNLNQTLRDEHQALQLAFNALEDKLRKVQDENRQMVDRLIRYKAKDAEKMNEENDNFLKKRNAKMQKELEEACRDTRGFSPEENREGSVGPMFANSSLPTTTIVKFDAHEGEVNAVKWSSVDNRLLATGGTDRKVKLWDITKGNAESRGVLQGSSAAVMSIDFDSKGNHILGASNDFASREWAVQGNKLVQALTGHCGKVLAAKYLGEQLKMVTGSHDRTLKIWDRRNGACIQTKFAGSSCNDLVTTESVGSTIISGHFDKRIRFWDTRTEASANDIVLNGKVTSLDLTRDGNYLVCCVRDDTLKLLDLRKNQVVQTFSCDGFKVGCDFARATFSPDGQYVAVGSADGSVYVWGVNTAKVETVLKEHTSATTATAWSPDGSYLASVDRSKRVIIWGDH